MSASGQKRLIMDLNSLLDKKVIVRTVSGREYRGVLSGFDHPNLNISLSNVRSGEETYHKVVISGTQISEILAEEEPIFNLEEFAEILEKYFPKQVRIVRDAGVILIADRISVSEAGVEGAGPIAERVKRIYDEYLEKRRKEIEGR